MTSTDSGAEASLWRQRPFLLLWAGQTVSELGSQISLVAIPLAAIVVLHVSALGAGVLTMFQFLPFLLQPVRLADAATAVIAEARIEDERYARLHRRQRLGLSRLATARDHHRSMVEGKQVGNDRGLERVVLVEEALLKRVRLDGDRGNDGIVLRPNRALLSDVATLQGNRRDVVGEWSWPPDPTITPRHRHRDSQEPALPAGRRCPRP